MKLIKQLYGVLLGGIYGLFCRVFFEGDWLNLGFNIFSISFVWIVPIIIALIPILFANKEVLNSKSKQFFIPVLSEFVFFIFALSSGLEDWICILIFSLPYLLAAGIIGLGLGALVKSRQSNKMFSIVLIPFLLQPIEAKFDNIKEQYSISSEVEIKAPIKLVWDNLTEVPEITNNEYSKGFFNYIGIPRPIKSEVKIVNGVSYRIGYFTQNLELFETVKTKTELKEICFEVHIDKSKLRDTPTDEHVLDSDFFRFKTITYSLEKSNKGMVRLRLSCDYQINTKMNWYANFWAKRVIQDFEHRLLQALKVKFENQIK